MPALTDALKLTAPESQREAGEMLFIDGMVLTVAVTALTVEGHTSIAVT